jgi:Cytochrome P450
VYALALHPEVLTTLHNEIEEVVGAQNPPTLDGIKRMKYRERSSCCLTALTHGDSASCLERDPALVPTNTHEYTKSR